MTDYDQQHWAVIQADAGVLPEQGARDAWKDYIDAQESDSADYAAETGGSPPFEGPYGERFDGKVLAEALEKGAFPGGAWRAWRDRLEHGS